GCLAAIARGSSWQIVLQKSPSGLCEIEICNNRIGAPACAFQPDLESIFLAEMLKILLQHGVIPGSCHTKARGISSPGIDKDPPHGALQSWRAAMEHYVGLDVSLKLTAICIVDQTGRIEREGVVASNPEAIAAFIKSHAPHVARIGLETGATSTWLWTEL